MPVTDPLLQEEALVFQKEFYEGKLDFRVITEWADLVFGKKMIRDKEGKQSWKINFYPFF